MTVIAKISPSSNWALHAMLCLVAIILCLLALGVPAVLYENVLFFGELVLLGGLGLLSLSCRPQVGIAVIILSGLFVPLQLETGTKTGLHLPFLLAPILIAAGLLKMVSRKHPESRVSSRTVLPLVLFLSVSVLSTAVAQFQWFPTAPAPLRAQIGGLAILLFSGGIFLVSARELSDLRWLERITFLFLIAGALRVMFILIPGIQNLAASALPSMGALGSMFWTWLTALAFSQAMVNRHLGSGWRLALAGLVIAVIYLTLAQWHDWASGWLPSCVAILVVIALRAPVLLAPLILAGGVSAAWNLEAIIHFFWTADQRGSYSTRLEMARALFQTIKAHLLLGSGPANYNHYLHFNSHNNYLDILAETGILGLLSLLWFLVELGRVFFRLRRCVPEGFPLAYVCGVAGGLAGTLCVAALGDWLLPFAYNIGVKGFRSSILAWIFFGGLVALEQVCKRRGRDDARVGHETPDRIPTHAVNRPWGLPAVFEIDGT